MYGESYHYTKNQLQSMNAAEDRIIRTADQGEIKIKTHDFEEAKKELKKFSEEDIELFNLDRVNEYKNFLEYVGGILLLKGINLDRSVTGKDLNILIQQIQKNLESINNNELEFVKQIRQVYTALESLDKEYINGILLGVESALKASEKADRASQKALAANREALTAQEDIKRAIEQQKTMLETQRKLSARQATTIQALQHFQEKLDSYQHLADVDSIWSDVRKQKAELENMKTYVENITSLADKQDEKINKLHEKSLTIAEPVRQKRDFSDKLEEVKNECAAKLKTAYILAGGAIGLAVLELILSAAGLM